MKPTHIKNLTESDLDVHTKVVIVANYFDSFCTSREIIELIQNPKTSIFVVTEILKLFSQVPFYGCNNKLVDALRTVYQNRDRYSNDHVKEVISGMGLHDVTFMYDKLVEDPPKYIGTISDGLYGANVEYLSNLISNNKARLMPVVKAHASAAQTNSGQKNTAYLVLMDICYVFSKDIENNLPVDVGKKIYAIENKVTANTFVEYLHEIFSTWPKIKFHYYDYNSIFESIHARFRPGLPLKTEGSIEIANVAAIKNIIARNTPVTSQMLDSGELAELSAFTGIGSSGYVQIIPCLYCGVPKGVIILEIEDKPLVDLPYLLGTVLIGKHIAKLVYKSAEGHSAMRYYDDSVLQHGFAVKSLDHEVNVALGRIIDSTKSLRRSHETSRDELDIISDIEEARDTIDNAVQKLKAYTDSSVTDKNINEVIENVLWNLKTHLKKGKIKVEFKKDTNNGIIVAGANINTILTNIITNSVKATQLNDLTREITISAITSQDKVIVTIADNGCGILPAIREKIFNENVTTWGSGVGLTIARFLAKEMGGEIQCGDPPVGAEFTVSLPRGGG